jgi:hypothetical protein
MFDSTISMSSSASTSDGESLNLDGAMVTTRLKELEDLKQEVLLLIQPYSIGSEEPPYTAGEMIIMALICSDNAPLSKIDALAWILKTFRYYSDLFIANWAERIPSQDWYASEDEEIGYPVGGFAEAFMQYELPLTLAATAQSMGRDTFTTDPRSARIYMRRLLEPPREKTFAFLEVPNELRNVIYEMVFSFSCSGIRVRHGVLESQRREGFPGGSIMNWELESLDSLEAIVLPPVGEILALLLVCRQINSEATPIFYNINAFEFPRPQMFVVFGNRMASNRFSNITKVSFDLTPPTALLLRHWTAFATMLAAHQPLEFLGITLADTDWLKMRAPDRIILGRRTAFTRYEQILGFSFLAAAVAQATIFELAGESPKFKQYLESEVSKIKAKAAAPEHQVFGKQAKKVTARPPTSSRKGKGEEMR